MPFFVQRETYEPVLLERRVKRMRLETGNPFLHHRYTNTLPRREIFRRAALRPTRMLCTSPIVFFTSLYVGLVYGYTYLLFTSFSMLYTET